MKKIFIYSTIVIALAIACDKADNEPVQKTQEPDFEVKMITEKITGTRENPTKVTIANSDGAFAWTIGDNIAVHVSNGDSHKYVFTSGEGGASTATASASFTVSYEEGYSRDAFAIYPSSIVSASAANYGQSGTSLDVTLPASYALSDIQGEKSPCPMIAINSPGSDLEFKQLCGMIRLTVNGIPSDATGMVIQFPGKKVNGDFSIATPVNPSASTIQTGVPSSGEDKITVTFSAGITSATVNIPLPTGDYGDVFVIPIGSATKVAASRFIKAGGYSADRAHAKKLTTTMVSFSVSDTKKVIFSPGNLVKTDATYTVGSGNETYAFESVPFNTSSGSLGYGSTPSSTSARGYFTWSEIISDGTTSNSPRSFTVNGVSDWSVLTQDEWAYLFDDRPFAGWMDRCYRVRYNSSTTNLGILIPPDGVTTSDVGDGTLSNNVNNNVDIYKYIEKGWVFLPGAGWRIGYWEGAGTACRYWTSTWGDGDTNGRTATATSSWTPRVNTQTSKTNYLSVRLVHVIE